MAQQRTRWRAKWECSFPYEVPKNNFNVGLKFQCGSEMRFTLSPIVV